MFPCLYFYFQAARPLFQKVRNTLSLSASGIEPAVFINYRNSCFFKEFYCVFYRKFCQGVFGKSGMSSPVTSLIFTEIAKITAPVSCDAELASGFFIMFQDCDRCSGFRRGNGGDKSCRPSAYDNDLFLFIHNVISFFSYSFCTDIRIPSFACSQVSPPWKYTA